MSNPVQRGPGNDAYGGGALIRAAPPTSGPTGALPGPNTSTPFGGVNPCWTDWTNSVTAFLTVLGLIVFGLFFLSFAIPRFWCRVCPIGAFVGYFNRGALLTLDKNPRKCSSCGTCRRNCPVDVEEVYRDRDGPVVTAPECQLCLTCLEDCPEPGCLELRFLGKRIVRS